MENKVLIETSARHIHLSQADLETLFGAGYTLTPKRICPSPASLPALSGWMWWKQKDPVRRHHPGPCAFRHPSKSCP